MDALDLLEQQHSDVRSLLDHLVSDPSALSSERARSSAIAAVEAHVRVEEAYVYVACGGKIRDDERVQELEREHARILWAARAILIAPPSGERQRARIGALRERFSRHADVEEDVVFPKLKRALTDEELDVLGEELGRAYGRLVSIDEMGARPLVQPLRVFEVAARLRMGRRGPRRTASI